MRPNIRLQPTGLSLRLRPAAEAGVRQERLNVTEPIIAYDYVFPVVGGDIASPGPVVRQVYGTAFYLANTFFVTNAHVIHSASGQQWWGLGFTEGQYWKFVVIDHYECFDDIDIGILSAPIPKAKNLKWSVSEEAMLTDVQVSGFPYALDLSESLLTIRAFRGTLVSTRTWNKLPNKPRVYELSFPCPRGLSGAPLWSVGPSPRFTGVVFGNSITEMVVYREVEKSTEDKEIIHEKVEALHLGLAIQSQSILSLKSMLLDTYVGDYLGKQNLLISA